MPLFGQIAAGIAGLLHVVFFVFESVLFKRPTIQRRFHVEPAAADAVRPWAFNQGFYNLFLAFGCVVGLAAMHASIGLDAATARAFVIFPCACMVGAGAVLIGTDRRMMRAGMMQLVPPLVALASLAV
jgi:putative membrane protein